MSLKKKEDLFEGFNFGDGFGIKSQEGISNGLGELLRSFGPRWLEEERHFSDL